MPEYNYDEKLATLKPAARARVEASLKTLIERELSRGAAAADNDIAAAFSKEHDRGPLFGREFDRQSRDLYEAAEIAEMDDAAFKKFAERLAVLKSYARADVQASAASRSASK